MKAGISIIPEHGGMLPIRLLGGVQRPPPNTPHKQGIRRTQVAQDDWWTSTIPSSWGSPGTLWNTWRPCDGNLPESVASHPAVINGLRPLPSAASSPGMKQCTERGSGPSAHLTQGMHVHTWSGFIIPFHFSKIKEYSTHYSIVRKRDAQSAHQMAPQ